MRLKNLADNGWKFHKGDFTEPRNRWSIAKSGSWNEGPESVGFDDSDWEDVTLPHDYVIQSELVPYMENEFDSEGNAIPEMQSVNNMHTTAGSFKKEPAWYRKHFFIPKEYEGKRLYFIFDGIYRDSNIFLNNFFVKSEKSGYNEIKCDISDLVNYGGENVLSVRVDPTGYEGWYYTGGGIYRHTYLEVTEPEHIENVFVHSEVNLNTDTAKISVSAEIIGSEHMGTAAEFAILNTDGAMVCTAQTAAENKAYAEFELDNAVLWDLDNPYLYTVRCRLIKNGEITDEISDSFGIRDIRFDADEGFFLNGRNIKLQGVCCHQNHGGVGTAMPDAVIEYRIKKLKEMGANAYRTSHYPQHKEILYMCDKYGLLVMDEARLLSSADEDLKSLEFLVKRDRNHPSVIMYSIGNEEAQSQATVQGAKIAGTMIEHIRAIDNTRPVTIALLMWDLANKRPIEKIDDIAGISKQLDIAGFNYHEHRWAEYHREYPKQPMLCTEQGTFKSTRGCYETDVENCYLAITDRSGDSYMKGARDWKMTAETPYICGSFIWTGFDYYGEPTPYAWPAVSSQFGAMDLCGNPKDFYYYYKAWWTDEPMVHIFTKQFGNVGEKRDIYVFSNCAFAEVFINGKSIGKKKPEKYGYLEWDAVAYEPGELSVIGYDDDGNEIARDSSAESGDAAALKLTEEIVQDGTAVINVYAVDADGKIVPYADNEFEIETDAEILGCSNGDPVEHTHALAKKRRLFNGCGQLILRYKSGSNVAVSATGLISSSLTLK